MWSSTGAIGWKEHPTLKVMMEMVMTQNYVSPPDMTSLDDIKVNRECLPHTCTCTCTAINLSHFLSQQEEILTYENHLASSSSNTKVTEANSYLLNHVTLLDPHGPPRKMLPSVIDLIRTVNTSLHLGQLLCQCREPDFLLDIINQQVRRGTTGQQEKKLYK